MGKFSRLGNELYTGQRSIDFIGRRAIWYSLSAVVIAIALSGLLFKGLNFGIEFTGGAQFRVSLDSSEVTQDNADKLRGAVAETGVENASSPIVATSGNTAILVQTEPLTGEESDQVIAAITDTVPVTADQLSVDEIGASWGQEVAERAGIGLVVFLFLVILFIWAYFREWKMSLAAMVALAHDVVITVGVYALSGFEVTPATVTGVLTILGFSLYDTVVVFDKVRENTSHMKLNRQTYRHAANLAVNQTLVRSINTSLVALIPVGAILYVGAVQLGASSLKDLALALFVGMAAGVYSSVFIATPMLVHFKQNETDVVLAEKRAKARARQAADPYAAVPNYAEDMPIQSDPEDATARGPVGTLQAPGPDEVDDGDEPVEGPVAPPRRPEATGRGRVAPQPRGPVGPSGASGRQQPTRRPRSKRGKP